MGILFLLFCYGLLTSGKCKMKREWRMDSKNKQPLPYFRRQVEEIYEDNSVESHTDDPRSKLIAFLIENVKEVFKDTDINLLNEFAESLEPTTTAKLPLSNFSLLSSAFGGDTHTEIIFVDVPVSYENLTNNPLPFLVAMPYRTMIEKFNQVTKRDKLRVSRDFLLLGESTKPFHDNTPELKNVTQPMVHLDDLSFLQSTVEDIRASELKRSCIHCNNVAVPECGFPKNKLIPSMLCEDDRDKCYSLHTPFGIVDRGCFNVQRNLSLYVCACNHCNSKSLSDMPYLFETKQEWIQNVVDLSFSRRLRKSIISELSCLQCEVKTLEYSDRETTDCVTGNVNSVPSQICDEKEICGIKAIRSTGYIWRGCVKSPLYNYWITFCNSDLCNYDEIISVYDTD